MSNKSDDEIIIDVGELDLILNDTITFDNNMNYAIDNSYSIPYHYNTTVGNVTIGGATGASGSGGLSGTYYTTAGMNGSSWGTVTTNPGLSVTGDATFEGDIKWKGRSLGKLLETIEDRLSILQEPDPKKLEKYAALKKAYEHYKTLERLIGED